MSTALNLEQLSNAALERAYWQAEAEYESRRRRRARQAEKRERFLRLRDFSQASWPILRPNIPLKWGKAADAICDHLEAVTRGEIRKLIINIAPRHTKSVITSINWPAWSWLFEPSLRWLFASYSLALSIDLSVECRRLIESPWYKNECGPDFVLTSDQNVKSDFDNNKQGSRFATAMTAAAAGFGGDLVVSDDPHNRTDANSPLAIKASIDGWKYNIASCLNDKINGRMVVIMQRICVGDLTDVLLEEGGWEHLCLPTEYDGAKRSTSLGPYDWREKEGELLFPERFDEKANADAKKTLGPQGYGAQYGQNPAPSGGLLYDINDFRKIHPDLIPKNLRKHRHWDLAATAEVPGKDPDFTAGVKMGIDDTDHKIYILDVISFRKDPAGVETEIKKTAKDDGIETSITIEEEKASAGKHVASQFGRHVLQGFIFRGQPICGDKMARARAFAAQVKFGNVYVPENAPWLFDYFDEMKSWPNSKHKDKGDGSSGAFNELVMNSGLAYNDPAVFTITDEGVLFDSELIPFEKLQDIGFISCSEAGYWAICRAWADGSGRKFIAEVWRRLAHASEAIEAYWRLHAKRRFDAAGIEQKLYDQYQSDFERAEEAKSNSNLANPLPIWPQEFDSDRSGRHRAVLSSAIANKQIVFAEHIPNNGPVWSQIINLQTPEDEARDAIAGAVVLAHQSF